MCTKGIYATTNCRHFPKTELENNNVTCTFSLVLHTHTHTHTHGQRREAHTLMSEHHSILVCQVRSALTDLSKLLPSRGRLRYQLQSDHPSVPEHFLFPGAQCCINNHCKHSFFLFWVSIYFPITFITVPTSVFGKNIKKKILYALL